MDAAPQLVSFTIYGQRYALALSVVERVIAAAQTVPLPGAPQIVLGALNLGGRITPVFNVRRRFGLPERPIDPSDCIIIARTLRRTVGLVADAVSGVVQRPDHDYVPSEAILPGLEYVAGAVKLEDGMILIHNLDRFLSLDEEGRLEEALSVS